MTKPYANTDVSVEKSQMQIDTLLSEHGITDIRWTSTTTLKALEFHYAIRELTKGTCSWRRGYCYEHYESKRTESLHGIKTRAVLGVRIVVAWSADDKERRRLMRVLWWMLKSKFEIVDAGLVVFEEEFMPHLTLGQGRRMWDAFRPELERRIDEGHDLSAGIGNESALLAIGSGKP